jgi:hypothetical protein
LRIACEVGDRNPEEFDKVCEYFLEVYENQGDFFMILSRLIRGAGMGLGVSGIVFTIWFFSYLQVNPDIFGVCFR